MKKSNLKKTMSVILALAMIFAMSTQAFATVTLTGAWVDEAPVFTAESAIPAELLAVTLDSGEITDYDYSSAGSGEGIVIGEVSQSANVEVWDGSAAEEAPATREIGGETFYEIANGNELAWFAGLVNGGETDANAILTADIYLNEEGTYKNNWISKVIGLSSSKQFAGTFDGAGFTIYGLYSKDKYAYQGGLFGYLTSDAVVKNLTLRNVKISTTLGSSQVFAGAIAAQCAGTIKNCSAYGEIVAEENGKLDGVGGIVGFLSNGTISECYSGMNIISDAGFASTSDSSWSSTNSCVGGIAAKAKGAFTFDKCGNGGTINVPKLYQVGGIAGYIEPDGAAFGDCYNTGNITAGWRAGGIFGFVPGSAVIGASLYNTGDIESKNTYAAGLFNNGKEMAENHASYSIGTVKVAEGKENYAGLLYTYDTNYAYSHFDTNFIYPASVEEGVNWTIGLVTCGNGVGTNRGTGKTLSEIRTQETVDTLNGWTGATTYIIDENVNNGYPVFAWQAVATEEEELQVWDGTVAAEAPSTRTIDDKVFYEIADGSELAWFANYVNDGNYTANAILTEDICLNSTGNYVNNWVSRAIGYYATSKPGHFDGVFDGDGHTIYGLYSRDSYAGIGGLFGIINATGVVKNLIMEDVRIVSAYKANFTGSIFAAPIARQSKGLIENVRTSGTITAEEGASVNGAAGIVSVLYDGIVRDCYSDINIISDSGPAYSNNEPQGLSKAESSVGGIVAYADYNSGSGKCEIIRCGFGGTINTPQLARVGGIIGNSYENGKAIKELSECYNTGNITGGYQVAGISANLSYTTRATKLYNTGNIHATYGRAAGLMIGKGGQNSYTTGTVTCGVADDTTSGLAYVVADAAAADLPNFIYPEFSEGISWPVGQSNTVSGIGTAKTLAEIKTQATVDTLNGWTGANTYKIVEGVNNGYPVFVWQKAANSTPSIEGNTVALFVKFRTAPGKIIIDADLMGGEANLSVYRVDGNWESGEELEIFPSYNAAAIETAVVTQSGELILNLGDAASILLVSDATLEISNKFKGVAQLTNDVIKASMSMATQNGTQNAMMIIAFLGNNGQTLKKVSIGDSVTLSQVPSLVSAEIDLTEENVAEGDILKAFVWSDFGVMLPLSLPSQLAK